MENQKHTSLLQIITDVKNTLPNCKIAPATSDDSKEITTFFKQYIGKRYNEYRAQNACERYDNYCLLSLLSIFLPRCVSIKIQSRPATSLTLKNFPFFWLGYKTKQAISHHSPYHPDNVAFGTCGAMLANHESSYQKWLHENISQLENELVNEARIFVESSSDENVCALDLDDDWHYLDKLKKGENGKPYVSLIYNDFQHDHRSLPQSTIVDVAWDQYKNDNPLPKFSKYPNAKKALEKYNSLTTDGFSEYLERKKINPTKGIRFSTQGDTLCIYVPMISLNGDLKGIQLIADEKIFKVGDSYSDKHFPKGTRKKALSFHVGSLSKGEGNRIVVCEGVATGISIFQADCADLVLCAFDAGNMLHVATELKEQGLSFVVAADNDATGLDKARKILKKNPSATVTFPKDISGTDFNDLHVEQDTDAVLKQFQNNKMGLNDFKVAFPILNKKKNPTPTTTSPTATSWEHSLKMNQHGDVRKTKENINIILSNHPAWRGVLGYNTFSGNIIKRKSPPYPNSPNNGQGEWTDTDNEKLSRWFSRNYDFEPSNERLQATVVDFSMDNPFNPVREYLEQCHEKWLNADSPRGYATRWVEKYFGAKESPATRQFEKTWLISAVARIYEPGCKADNVLILEGEQGLLKSTALSILGGEWFNDTSIDFVDKDSLMRIHESWIIEMPELDKFKKADSDRAKSFFSRCEDKFRVPYGHNIITKKRQCVFAGTTNTADYLKDSTGNRRYMPIECLKRCDIDALKADRDLIWGEAVQMYKYGEPWWYNDTIKEIQEAQAARFAEDVWTDHIQEFLKDKTNTTIQILLTEALGMPLERCSKLERNRMADILRGLGWRMSTNVMIDGHRRKGWILK